jgi:hypothetical protein
LITQQPFITLVDQILAAKKKNGVVGADPRVCPDAMKSEHAGLPLQIEHQIDQLVYKLHDLT